MASWAHGKMGLSRIGGTFLGGLHNKDYSIWGSILGSPYFGKQPNVMHAMRKCIRLLVAGSWLNS